MTQNGHHYLEPLVIPNQLLKIGRLLIFYRILSKIWQKIPAISCLLLLVTELDKFRDVPPAQHKGLMSFYKYKERMKRLSRFVRRRTISSQPQIGNQ